MNWLQSFTAAIDYIEANLEQEIDYEQAARISNCSACHFFLP